MAHNVCSPSVSVHRTMPSHTRSMNVFFFFLQWPVILLSLSVSSPVFFLLGLLVMTEILKYWPWSDDCNNVDPKYCQFTFLLNLPQLSFPKLWAKVILKSDSVKPLELVKNFCIPDTKATGRTSTCERESRILEKPRIDDSFNSGSLSYLAALGDHFNLMFLPPASHCYSCLIVWFSLAETTC